MNGVWRVRGQSAKKRAKFNRLSGTGGLDLLTATPFGNEHDLVCFRSGIIGCPSSSHCIT
jgi:hypothetical protein